MKLPNETLSAALAASLDHASDEGFGTGAAPMICNLNSSVLRPDASGFKVLDTAGATEGCLQYRYIWTEDNPMPSVRTVPFDAVRSALPDDHPVVTPDERRRVIQARQRCVGRREQVG